MKNVYLVQPNNVLSASAYLPYAAGAIAAYSWQFEEIKSEYCLAGLLFMKDSAEEVIADMNEPYIVGFSSYMWNVEYNLHLAEKIKQRWHNCIIAFGGPQIPDNTEYLEAYPFIDILMHSEGETTFYDILSALKSGNDLCNVANISYRSDEKIIKTIRVAPGSVKEFPSPYTMGLYDSILADERYKGMQFDAIIETNRGCPYKCTYCCWGDNDAALRQFPMERVLGDLEWLAMHKIAYVFCADANFGIFPRDEEIVDFLVELKKKHGYPQKFETTSAKDKDEITFRINSKLHSAGLNRGVSLACQSMSPTVLKNIGRKNMSLDFFSSQLKKYREAGIDTYTDLIIGLPGETYESFCRGLFNVIEAGQHCSVNAYNCELLPNSALHSPETVEKYKIKTVLSHLCQNHSRTGENAAFSSRSEIVVETNTMSREDWKNALRVSICTQSFHSMGLLRFFAIYLRRAKGVSYYDFYMTFFKRIAEENALIFSTLKKVTGCIDLFLEGKANLSFSDKRFGDIYFPFDEGLFLCCVAELDGFYAEAAKHLRSFFDDDVLFSDLLEFQKSIINTIGDRERTIETKYDWLNYFADIYNTLSLQPTKKETYLRVFPECIDNPTEYAKKIVWFGKRSDKMIISNIQSLTKEEL